MTMSNAATDLAPSTDHVVALVRRWLAESAEHPGGSRRRAPRRRAEGPERARLHRRLRRRRHATRRPGRRRPQPRARRASSPRSSCPGTCAPPSASAASSAPVFPWIVIPIARRVLRAMVGHLVLDATPGEARPRHREAARIGQPAQPQPARRGRARRGRGRPPPARHLRVPRPRRRRLRVDQGVERRQPALDVVVRRGRRQGRRQAHPALRAGRADRGPGTAEVHQPRHGGVPRPRPHDRGVHDACSTSRSCAASRPASCCRPTCPTRSARCRSSPRGRPRAAPAGGAPIKVRVVKGANLAMEHVDAADPRLAARHLRHQAGHRHQLQARAATGR